MPHHTLIATKYGLLFIQIKKKSSWPNGGSGRRLEISAFYLKSSYLPWKITKELHDHNIKRLTVQPE